MMPSREIRKYFGGGDACEEMSIRNRVIAVRCEWSCIEGWREKKIRVFERVLIVEEDSY